MRRCDPLVVFVDSSSPSRRILGFLTEAGCEGHEVRYYKGHEDDIIMLEGGSSLLPLVWNKINNKIIVGCPLKFEEFLEKLEEVLR